MIGCGQKDLNTINMKYLASAKQQYNSTKQFSKNNMNPSLPYQWKAASSIESWHFFNQKEEDASNPEKLEIR